MRRIDADKLIAESRVLCDSCTLRDTEKCTDICVVNLICKRVDLQPTVTDRYDEVNEESVIKMAQQIQAYCYQFQTCVDCPFYYGTDMCALERPYNYQVSEV